MIYAIEDMFLLSMLKNQNLNVLILIENEKTNMLGKPFCIMYYTDSEFYRLTVFFHRAVANIVSIAR